MMMMMMMMVVVVMMVDVYADTDAGYSATV